MQGAELADREIIADDACRAARMQGRMPCCLEAEFIEVETEQGFEIAFDVVEIDAARRCAPLLGPFAARDEPGDPDALAARSAFARIDRAAFEQPCALVLALAVVEPGRNQALQMVVRMTAMVSAIGLSSARP